MSLTWQRKQKNGNAAKEIAARKAGGVRRKKSLPVLIPEAISKTDSSQQESRAKAAKAAGTSPRYVSDAKKLRKEAPDLLAKVRKGDLKITQAMRQLKDRQRQTRQSANFEKVANLPKVTAAVGVKFATILIDPPWDFSKEGDKEVFGRTNPTYATMTDEQIAALPLARMGETTFAITTLCIDECSPPVGGKPPK